MAKHQFQAEVHQLLKLIIHSLYSNKDIFIRELISNSSDALDKLKYLTVSDDAFKSIQFDPRIDISFDEKEKTVTFQDNGIGMSEDDLNNNLGTIARSGTKAFLEQLNDENAKNSDLIGQFGVGFYSAFMVASKIDVFSRKANTDKLLHWFSDGLSSYDLEDASDDKEISAKYGFDDASKSGTAIIVHLNNDEDNQSYLSQWKLQDIIKRYSDNIAFPIFLHYPHKNYDDKGKEIGSEIKVDQMNSGSALWKRPKSELTKEDYIGFYKTIGLDACDPLTYIHTHAEGTLEYTTLFYIPGTAPFDMYNADYRNGVRLYVKRVFITDEDKDLLPSYLRFVRGVIDSEDLPLNVSREILQQNGILANIKNASVKRILAEFKRMEDAYKEAKKAQNPSDEQKEDIDKWCKFVNSFNRPLKEGLYSDYVNREELLDIVQFKSTDPSGTGKENWTSFADYVTRMKKDQKVIYYISGADEDKLRANPLVKTYENKGFEVLIFDDEIDEIVIPAVEKYKDFEIKAINRIGKDSDLKEDTDVLAKQEEEFKKVIDKAKKSLENKVKDVKLTTNILEDCPSCVVIDADDPSFQMEKIMKSMGQVGPVTKPILKLNANHPLVIKLKEADDQKLFDKLVSILLDQALLTAGMELDSPTEFINNINELLIK